MKRVLVTGGRGFIGRHTLAPLLSRGFEVHATASSDDIPADLTALPVTWHVCDLLKKDHSDALIRAVAPSHLLHTAWITDHRDYWTNPKNLAWVAATLHMVLAFSQAGGQRYVSAGTCAEYEWSTDLYDELTSKMEPATLYGRAKLTAHELAIAASDALNISVATGRVFFAYGPNENPNRIVPYACQMLAKGHPAQFASGTLERDFLHVSDAGQGFAALLDSDLTGPVNIASGIGVTLGTIVTKLGQIAGSEDLIELGALSDRPNDPSKMVANISRIWSTGWRPQIDLKRGLEDTFSWWRKHSEYGR
jgi:nucleoside-diphosphate-sugar epimerase